MTSALGRYLRAIPVAVVSLALLIVAAAVVFYEREPGDDSPVVLVSLDRTLWNRIGFSRFTYIRALRQAGLRPILIEYGRLPEDFELEATMDRVSGLVLSGGGDVSALRYGGDEAVTLGVSSARDEFELGLLQAAERRGMPVLGICRGAQLLNVHRGGTLGDFRHDSLKFKRHRRLLGGHAVDITKGTKLFDIYETTSLNRVVTWHGQYVDRPGDGVRVTGYAPDGTPEAIEVESDDPFGMIGVQWHAEVLPWDGHQRKLFTAFSEAVLRFTQQPALHASHSHGGSADHRVLLTQVPASPDAVDTP